METVRLLRYFPRAFCHVSTVRACTYVTSRLGESLNHTPPTEVFLKQFTK